MQLQTILNKVQKFKGYVYENVTLSQDGKKLDVLIRPRSGSSPTCSDCGRKANNSWENVTAIGIDEIAWKKGHKYLTLVYQINEGGRRLLFVAQERTKESLAQFFRMLKADKCQRIEYVVSDMWRNYLDVVQEFVPNAVHVLDRFHVMKKFMAVTGRLPAFLGIQLSGMGGKVPR